MDGDGEGSTAATASTNDIAQRHIKTKELKRLFTNTFASIFIFIFFIYLFLTLFHF